MKRKLYLGAFAIVFSISALLFGGITFAGGDSKGKRSDERSISSIDTPAVSTTLVLSQVYGGGGGTSGTYSADYIEIKNISATPQSLDSLRLMYGSATGQFGSSTGNIIALPNITLNPGQYFLVQAGTVGAGGSAVPNPDLTNTSTNLSGASGKMALVTAAFVGNTCGATATPCTLPNANIIDSVSFGASNNAEGGAPTNSGAALTSTQGNVRKGNGCIDTDNNNNDFDVITAPVPRNSSSPAQPCGAAPAGPAVVDFNGDGRTDFGVIRSTGGPSGGLVWYNKLNGPDTVTIQGWGIATDLPMAADYDGDGKADLAVWRQAAGTGSGFYILRSSDGTFQFFQFGQGGDDPYVVGDYDGDGKADPAIYREGSNASSPSTFWFYPSGGPLANTQVAVNWGVGGDRPVPGDFNGDGKADFGVARGSGGSLAFFTVPGTGAGADLAGLQVTNFGFATDDIVPGDYDGDGKTDIAVVRSSGGALVWFVRRSLDGNTQAASWGVSATDEIVQGDYDGDGKTDYAVWRASSTAGQSAFIIFGSTAGVVYANWGQQGDITTQYDIH
jgi:hypothetical protein